MSTAIEKLTRRNTNNSNEEILFAINSEYLSFQLAGNNTIRVITYLYIHTIYVRYTICVYANYCSISSLCMRL